MSLSNYPPGVTGNEPIFGTHDITISFTISFLYEDTLETDERIEDIPQIIKDTLLIDDLQFDQNTFSIDKLTGKYSITVIYADDMCYDASDIYYDTDINEIIIHYMNDEIMPYQYKLSMQDSSIEIDYDIHR